MRYVYALIYLEQPHLGRDKALFLPLEDLQALLRTKACNIRTTVLRAQRTSSGIESQGIRIYRRELCETVLAPKSWVQSVRFRKSLSFILLKGADSD